MLAPSAAARSGYSRSDAPHRNPRSLEYELLARASQRLSQSTSGRKADFPALVAALDENTRLWATLAADVAEPSNALPANLRAQLFYLYEFTARHSRDVRENRASVGVLIDINTAVMRGLRGEGTAA